MWAKEEKQLLAITESSLCVEPLLERVELLARGGISALILRHKEGGAREYRELAREALGICARWGVLCILHSFSHIAQELGGKALHCQSAQISDLPRYRRDFSLLGVSVHSVEEYLAARKWADYVVAGHIFESSCKAGLKPRGLPLLQELQSLESNVSLESSPQAPRALRGIYAIGGITLEKLPLLSHLAIAGVCMREALMTCDESYVEQCLLALRGSSHSYR